MKVNFVRYFMATLIAALVTTSSYAQVAAYSFSQSVGTFNSIAATGTPAGFGIGWDDDVSSPIDLNFSFVYNGVAYTQCYINTNGAVEFTDPTDNRFQPYLDNDVANSIIIMGEDLNDNDAPGSDILYTTTGTPGSQVFTVEWSHCRRYDDDNEDLNMQVKLYEGTNKCEIVYGGMTFSADDDNTCQVGLSGPLPSPISDFNIRTTDQDWTATTAGVSYEDEMYTGANAILPSGLTYDWVLVACSGQPIAGTLAATQPSGCSPFTTYISFTASLGSGIAFQYQSSADGINWANINNATSPQDTVYVTAPIYIRAYVTCTNSGLSDTTAGLFINYVPESVGTAALPYFQSFENWSGTCYGFDRPDSNWINTPAYGDSSWRRDDQGSNANWTDVSDGNYFPASTEAAHSARFHSYYADENTEGRLDLHIDLSAAGTKNINFDYNNEDGDDYLNVELSEDGGNTFTILGTVYSTNDAGWLPALFTTTSVAANAIIRFDAVSDFGGTDIGLDSLSISMAVTPPPVCAAPTNLTSSNGTATSIFLSWTPVPGAAGYEYTVDQVPTDPLVPGTATANSSVTVTGLTPGTAYYGHVRTDCTGGDTSSWVTVSFTTDDTCLIPTNVTAANITATSADISWTAVLNASTYQYTLDQVPTAPLVAGTTTASTTYSATGLIAGGTYYFHVRTECNNTADSSGWVTITINLLTEGINNVAGSGFGIIASPNPTGGLVNLSINGGSAGSAVIIVTDVVGKVIMPQTNVTGSKMQLDMSQLAPGTYFVNYSDNEHKQTIKVNKQ